MSEPQPESPAIPRILPRGRHGLGEGVVKQSQRLRILEAMTSLCAEKGYAATSVADVLDRSGVSRKTFYEQFENKEDCLLAAYDAGMERLNDRIATAVEQATRDGRNVLRSSISAYLDALTEDPDFANLLAVEMLAGGPTARKRRDDGFEMFVELYRTLLQNADQGRAVETAAEQPSEDQIVAAIGAVAELIRRTVSLRGPEALPTIKEQSVDITWTLLNQLTSAPK